ncbi:MAG: glycosyltransferase N-terminal domain-containing protein [Bacteroidota bacterium]
MLYYIGFVLYLLATNAYFLVIKLIAPFNARAKAFNSGRKGLLKHIEQSLQNETRQSIWFHVASLGEFEQAKPLIEVLKVKFPQYCIVITFFSPSGYENKKDDSIADYIFYLPNDSKKNAVPFIKLIKPAMAFWVKYDFWYYYLNQLSKNNIPVYLIAASFTEDHAYLKWYAAFYKKMFHCFRFIFTQNTKTALLLNNIGINQTLITGDTRFDRVYQSVQQFESLPLIEQFKQDKLLIVVGSSYVIEETFLQHFMEKNPNTGVKIIIAPHFISPERLDEIEQHFTGILRFSQANATNIEKHQSLLIDNIGMLSKIYRYADIAFIGGGFKAKGLHNILEAATFGKPIIHGDKIGYFPEAKLLNTNKGSIVVNDETSFETALSSLLNDKDKRLTMGNNAKQLVLDNVGATEKIISKIIKA